MQTDVLQTLAACAEHYDSGTMAQYSVPLWDALKYEVISAQEPELADETLITLRSIAMCLSKSNNTSPKSSPLALYLKPIIKECLEHLQEPAQRQAKASGDILKAISSASAKAFESVFKAVVPPILVVYQSADGILQQRALLEVFNQLFESAITLFGSWQSKGLENGYDQDELTLGFKDKFIAMYSQALMRTVKEEVSFRLTAAKGLLLLSKMRSFLQENEIGLFVQYFDDIVLNEESYGRDELKRTAMLGLAEISASKPRLVMDITFPAFIARLPDSEDDATMSPWYQATLEGLAEISIEKELLATLIRRLLNRLDILFRSSQSGPFPYTCAIISTILYVFNRTAESTGQIAGALDSYYDRIVVDLCRRMSTQADVGDTGPLGNEAVLDLLGRLDNLVIRCSSPQRLPQLADNIYSLFSAEQMDDGKSNIHRIFQSPKLVVLSTWLMAALPRDVQASIFQIETTTAIVYNLIDLSRQSSNKLVQLSCLRQVALYINKHVSAADLQKITNMLTELFETLSSIDGAAKNSDQEINVQLVFAIAKALILRLSPKTNDLLSSLVSLLDSNKYPPRVCRTAASGFGSILAPDDVLSKKNYFQIRLLAPQRVFQVLTPLISAKFKSSSSSEEKQSYLTALSGVVATVPSEIVLPQLPTLFPLLLQSLDLSDQAVKISTLETIAIMIANNPSALEESGHIPALVKRLLTSAAIPKSQAKQTSISSLPRTRRLATKCLALLPSHITTSGSRTNPLLPLKRDVLQGLMRVLDDPKRDVRKEGVDARAAWIRGVDDPQDDDDED
jgi:DNA repair/transcription protein MET18/MMS19